MFLFSLIIISIISVIFIMLLIRYPVSISVPSSRGLHLDQKPSSGGLAIFGAYLLISIYAFIIHHHGVTLSSPILSLFLITIIGFCDDKYELSKIFRFVAQGIISCLTILSFDLALTEIIIWMIFFIFFINIYNFMDGIDGLAASQAIFILLCFSFFNNFYSINSLILYIIPIIIFLLYNVSPSKIFLGNTGSYLLGLLIAILIFNSSMRLSDIGFINHLMITAIILTVFIADTVYVLVVRLIRNIKISHNIFSALEYITTPHKSHFYQILAKKYTSHNKSTLFIMLYNVFWCLPILVFSYKYIEHVVFFVILSYLPYFILCYKNSVGKE